MSMDIHVIAAAGETAVSKRGPPDMKGLVGVTAEGFERQQVFGVGGG